MTKSVKTMVMPGKVTTAAWFLKNPQYLPQVMQILRRKTHKTLENSAAEALKWCRENCTTQQKALQELVSYTGVSQAEDEYPQLFESARRAQSGCPVKMGGEGAVNFIYQLVKHSQVKNILETGVAYGWSTFAILLAVESRNDALLVSNDMPYINMGNEDYVGCIIPGELKHKWQLQRLPDIKGIPLALQKFPEGIDFCHYDSDKSYTGRMWASPVIWRALNPGSLFVADDINDNLAFRDFSASVDRKPVIIEHLGKYVGVIVK